MKKVSVLLLMIFFQCAVVAADEYEVQENFKMIFNYSEDYSEQFIMNIKEVNDGFVGLKYDLPGGREVVKFNSQGEEVYENHLVMMFNYQMFFRLVVVKFW